MDSNLDVPIDLNLYTPDTPSMWAVGDRMRRAGVGVDEMHRNPRSLSFLVAGSVSTQIRKCHTNISPMGNMHVSVHHV